MHTAADEVVRALCPYCGQPMKRTLLPPETAYPQSHFWVCFNDLCEYYVRGWNWMWEHYRVKASYRCRMDPVTGRCDPLPVWSPTAMRDQVLD